MSVTNGAMRATRSLVSIAVAAGVLTLGFSIRKRRAAAAARPAALDAGATAPFIFAETSSAAGLANVHEKFESHVSLKGFAPVLAAEAGASVAVADADGDGWMDVYLTNAAVGSRNRLFHNNHDGTFTDIAARMGVADVNKTAGSLRAIFFDYDNDGRKDLFLSTTWCSRLFHNEGARFVEVTERMGLSHCGFSVASNVIDYDGDGYPDLVVADFFGPVDLSHPSTSRFWMHRSGGARDAGPILIYHNERGRAFREVPGALGIKSRGFTQALGVYDLRGTGRRDLYFATDGGYDQFYENEGPGRPYANASETLQKGYSEEGMSAEIADIDNDGHPAIFVSDDFSSGNDNSPNFLLKFEAGKERRNSAEARGVGRCGWAWGAKFADLDNDGWLDLVVSNGLISADPQKDYWYSSSVMDGADRGLREDVRNWPPIGKASWAGYQNKCVYRGIGGGRFQDVTALTAFKGDVSDGRGVAAVDFLNDGRVGVAIANVGQPFKFYANRTRNANHWIGFDLRGRRSGRDAWGSQVTVRLRGGLTLARELEPANGYLSQSDGRIHFGLGPQAVIEAVHIRWPSGARQTLHGLALDRYHALDEP